MPYNTFPAKTSLKPEEFHAHVPDLELEGFKIALRISRLGPKTYENQVTDAKDYRGFGISRQWLSDAKDHWIDKYDWRKTEDRINSYNNWTVDIEHEGFEFHTHFVGLLSKKKDAIPLLLLHGWPGSFLEFLHVVDEFRERYDEDNLPFHVIVPSLPGTAYSNGPPIDKNFNVEGMAQVMDKLMDGLGFGSGYIAQGGDIGSFIARVLYTTSEACKAIHINLCIGVQPESEDEVKGMSERDQKAVRRMMDFNEKGSDYARYHGSRPATNGLVLSSSPLALLAWLGEKFIQWTDKTPPLDEILDGVTLYWFTESQARSIYGYRQFFNNPPQMFHNDKQYYGKKPMGYVQHPEELAPVPVSLVAKTGNLVWHKEHPDGGHFYALETPKRFVDDLVDFSGQVWDKAKL